MQLVKKINENLDAFVALTTGNSKTDLLARHSAYAEGSKLQEDKKLMENLLLGFWLG